MGWPRLFVGLLAAGSLLVSESSALAKKPELVTVPMATRGVSAAEGLEAWKLVTDAIDGSKARLGVSVALQKRRHDFVVGPAREQAKDCDGSVDCLQAIGGALGADILVTGHVTPQLVALVAIEINTGRLVGEAETPRELSKAPLDSRASAAARLLVAAMAPEDDGGPVAGGPTPGPTPVDDGGPTAGPTPIGAGGGDLKGFDDTPPPPPPPASTSAALQGTLRISSSQLRGVSRVAVDGETLPFRGDGSIEWRGAPGDHRLVAVKADGARLSRNVFVEPGSATDVVLEWPDVTGQKAAEARTTARRSDKSDGSVFTAWWFWTALGAAVVAGGTTAALLAGGNKGGPTLPNETGRIAGTY